MKHRKDTLKGKRIDCHTHAGVSYPAFLSDKYPYCFGITDLLSTVKRNGFDAAVVFPFPSPFCGRGVEHNNDFNVYLKEIYEKIPYLISNKRLIDEKRIFGDSELLPFCMFSINYKIKEQIDFITENLDSVYGLKYYPEFDGNSIPDLLENGKDFLAFLQNYSLPLTIHSSDNANRTGGLSNAEDMLEIVKEYPGLRLCVAHMGHFNELFFNKVFDRLYPNLYVDLSPFFHICNIRVNGDKRKVVRLDYKNYAQVVEYFFERIPHNLLWGSDLPFNFTCNLERKDHDFNYANYSLEKHVLFFNTLSQEIKDAISKTNILSFLFG